MSKKLVSIVLSACITSCSLLDLFNPPQLINPNTEENTEIVDNGGQEGEPSEQEPVERKDLFVAINFTYPEERDFYAVGDNFNFLGKVQNAGSEFITVDNSLGNSLECRLLKEGEEIWKETIKEPFVITLREHGFLEAKYEDDKLELSILNADVLYNGKTYSVYPPLKPISMFFDLKSYVLKESGKYSLSFVVNYSLEGEEYKSTFKSEEVEARDEVL